MSLRRECPLLAIIDAHTLKVEWEGQVRLARMMDVDPESATCGGSKPATRFGRQALEWARQTFFGDTQTIVLEFPDTETEFSNSGKLLCYCWAHSENYNVRLVREGWSPCFEKYGRPRIHRAAMEQAELWARAEGLGIWSGMGDYGNYQKIKNYCQLRAGQVDDFRHMQCLGEDIQNTRLHYADIVAKANAESVGQVFAELCRLAMRPDGSATIQLGSPSQPFDAVFPRTALALAHFLEREFIGYGKPNYLYLTGRVSQNNGHPQIMIERMDQVATHPTRA